MPKKRRRRHPRKSSLTNSDKLIGGGLVGVGLFVVFGKVFSQAKSFLMNNGTDLVNAALFVVGCVIFLIVCTGIYKAINSLYNFFNFQCEISNRNRKFESLKNISQIRKMDPFLFEKFVGYILEKEGLTNIQVTNNASDEGVDLYASQNGKRVAVQVKRYSERNKVGRVDLQNFVGAFIHAADEGWFVTSGNFNKNALEYASKYPQLRLIDGIEFGHMMNRLPDNDWMQPFIIDPLKSQRSNNLT